MKLYKYVFLICCMSLTGSGCLQAQKAYKSIRESIKNRNNLEQALKTVAECKKNEKQARDPELYFLGATVYQKMNDIENEKLYLKQAYDTAKFFSSILGLFDFTLQCDSVDQLPDEKGKVRIKYRNKNRSLLKRYYNNLRAASKFYMLKKDYNKAYPFISMYLNSAKSTVLASEHYEETDTSRARLAYWATLCLFKTNRYEPLFNYCDLALQDTAYRCSVIETMAKSYGEVKDTTQMLSTLRKGIREYPEFTYFFTKLFDYYNTHALYDKALMLADTMQTVNPKSTLFRYAKSVAHLNLKNYDECITESLNILKLDSAYAEAYYNVGICLCNKAEQVEDKIKSNTPLQTLRQQKLEVSEYYRKARPFMERYRFLMKEESAKWAPPLYRIYLNLNMGKQFDEIDKLLKEKAKA